MNLNLSKFKKISEDKHSAILAHPDGHKFKIAKHVLSPKLRGQIAELPMHLAEGGDVTDPTQLTDDQLAAEAKMLPKRSGMPEEEARSKDPNFQTQFPGQQAPVVIQVGSQQQPQGDVRNPPMNNGSVDWDQYAVLNPEAPLSVKTEAMKRIQNKELEEKAFAQSREQKGMEEAQANKAQALQYNQFAAARGLPQVQIPEAPEQKLAAQPAVQEQNTPEPSNIPQRQTSPQDPYGTEAYYQAYSQGLGEQKQGILGGAEAESQLGRQQAETLGTGVAQQQKVQQSFQDHFNQLDHERQNFQQDLLNQHIDPKRYLSNMGAGQKIFTMIGLILGGAGSGLTGQSNPAMDFLNKQMTNDIEAQKTEMGKGENLLAANMKQFGNLYDATRMTQIMQMDIVKNQLAQQAAKSSDPLIKARAQQAIGQLDMQAAPILSQMAMRKALLSGVQQGGQDPSMAIRMIVPEHQQQEAFKELKEGEEQVKGRDAAMSAFDQLNQVNTIGNRVTSPIQTPKQADALRNNLAVQLARAAAGRVNEYEFEAAKQLFPAVGDDAKTVQTKRQALTNFIQEKMNHPILNAYGINLGTVKQGGRYGEQGQKKIQLGAPVQGKTANVSQGK